MIGDLFATLIRSLDSPAVSQPMSTVSLAVFSVTAIQQHGKSLGDITLDRLKSHGPAAVVVYGQILRLIPHEACWYWTGDYALIPTEPIPLRRNVKNVSQTTSTSDNEDIRGRR